MARPQKEGLDYFPVDVDMDDKVKLIDSKFGVAGFGVLVKVWQIVYENGYYIMWTEKELLLYKNRINADINLINDVINECLKWNIFSIELYEKYKILTSSGIQKRFFEATKRRQTVTLTGEFLLTPIPDNYKPIMKEFPAVYVCKNSINVNNNEVNAHIGTHNVDINSQSKEKKSKVKESKEYCVSHDAQPPVMTFSLNDNSEYPIPQKLIDDMAALYPAVDVMQQFRSMKAWLISNPTKRKTKSGVMRFINSWLAKEQNRGRPAQQPSTLNQSNPFFAEAARLRGESQ